MGQYDDIINLDRPKSIRPKMSLRDRAKIFMPFAALKGYEEAIEYQKIELKERIELMEEGREALDEKLKLINEMQDKSSDILYKIVYYKVYEDVSREENRELGKYIEKKGRKVKVDYTFSKIKIDDVFIDIKDVYDIIWVKEGEA